MPDHEPLYVLTTADLIRLAADIRSGDADDLAAYVESHAVDGITVHDRSDRTFDLTLFWDLARSARPVEIVQ